MHQKTSKNLKFSEKRVTMQTVTMQTNKNTMQGNIVTMQGIFSQNSYDADYF